VTQYLLLQSQLLCHSCFQILRQRESKNISNLSAFTNSNCYCGIQGWKTKTNKRKGESKFQKPVSVTDKHGLRHFTSYMLRKWMCQSQWPRAQRRRSTAPGLLRSWVRNSLLWASDRNGCARSDKLREKAKSSVIWVTCVELKIQSKHRMAERKNTIMRQFDPTSPRISAHEIHDWIHDVLKYPTTRSN
jgi:hypothetical protein